LDGSLIEWELAFFFHAFSAKAHKLEFMPEYAEFGKAAKGMLQGV
jgi:hypothetical protein